MCIISAIVFFLAAYSSFARVRFRDSIFSMTLGLPPRLPRARAASKPVGVEVSIFSVIFLLEKHISG
jgi:hypothetical protein